MRSPVVLCVLAAIGSCGPSNREVALAKTARFKADKLTLFAATKWVTERKHQIYQSDETELTIHTKARWYTPNGLGSQWTIPGDVIAMGRDSNPLTNQGRPALQDLSLNISMVVRILPEATNWIVYIETKIYRYNVGMPNLEKVDSKRIDLPGWATGKADQLAYEIYKALQRYQVKPIRVRVEPGPTPPPIDPAEPHPVDVPGINAGSGSGSDSSDPHSGSDSPQ